VNINLNIVIASLASIALAAYPVKLAAGISDNVLFILLSAFLIDAIFDFTIFSILHVLLNFKNGFIFLVKDIGTIQIHRIVLSVLFFIISVGTDFVLMQFFGIERAASFVVAYVFALIITRTVHTVYGIKSGLFKDATERK